MVLSRPTASPLFQSSLFEHHARDIRLRGTSRELGEGIRPDIYGRYFNLGSRIRQPAGLGVASGKRLGLRSMCERLKCVSLEGTLDAGISNVEHELY